jgi:septal ring factor EnvC (AmiA/AmiB activator)
MSSAGRGSVLFNQISAGRGKKPNQAPRSLIPDALPSGISTYTVTQPSISQKATPKTDRQVTASEMKDLVTNIAGMVRDITTKISDMETSIKNLNERMTGIDANIQAITNSLKLKHNNNEDTESSKPDDDKEEAAIIEEEKEETLNDMFNSMVTVGANNDH